jgi:hypothetical protein|nr:hypothetical protein [uncultured Flavobacterium sp.]
MLKKYFLLCFLITWAISQSQEVINSTPVALKKNKAVFQIVNNSTNETTLFVADKEKVKAIRLNKEMQIIDSLSTERLNPSTYTAMIGYNENKSRINLFWTSPNHKDLFIQQFNFDKLNSENKNLSLPLKEEKFLQSFSQNDKFYILTILKNSNKLKFYIFDNANLEEKIIDLTGFNFYKSDYQKTTLYGIFGEFQYNSELSYSLQKINPENPTSLVESSKKRKCYSIGKTIIMTFDNNIDYTQLITLNLESFTAKEQFVKKPPIAGDRLYLNSNSFLIDDKLYQIKTTSNQLIFTIKDLEDKLIKSYQASDTNPIIDFKNSNIIQENGKLSNKRILETSAQFIRKTNNLNAGISCYKLNSNYLVTIGSVSEQQQQVGTGAIVGGMFGAVGSIAGSLIDSAISNPTMESFNSYANRKVVYINGLFDKEFTHVKGEIEPLAFDKIRIFFDKNTDVSSQTLYKLDNIYYLGYYDNLAKEYTIRKFID